METQKTNVTRRRTVLSIGRDREDELEDLAKRTAQAVLDQEDGENPEEEDFSSVEDYEDKIKDDVRQINEENPFMIAERLVEEGIDIEFNIKKGGRYLTKVDDPEFNEEKLQQFGEGTYTVALYKLTPKRAFVKQQTFRVASAPVSSTQERKTNETHIAEIMLKQTADQLKTMQEQFAEKERRMEEQRKEEKRQYELDKKEAREREEKKEEERRRNEGNSKNSLLETLEIVSKLMPKQEPPKDNSDKFMEMMMKMQENTQKLIEKMDEKNKEAMRESKTEMKELIEKISSKKSDGVSERELREAIDKARREGKEDYKELVEMAEVKAIERAELLSGREPAEKEPESMTDTLIKNALPMLMQGMMKRPQAPMLNPPPRRVAPPEPRRVMPPITVKVAPATQNTTTGIRTAPKAPVQTKAPVASTAPKTAVKAQPQAQNTLMQMSGPPIMDLSGINLSQNPKSATIASSEEKDAVGQLLMQVVGSGIMDGAQALEVSKVAYHALKAENLLSERVFDYYPMVDLIALKDQFGLAVDNNWIETFYVDFKKRFNANGEHV